MLPVLQRYLIKMRNKADLRQVILRDFYLENLQSMINQQPHAQMDPNPNECEEEEKGAGYEESLQMQIFDSQIIKDCVLRAR